MHILRDKRYLPIYFHCDIGRDRTSLIAGLYQIYFREMSPQEAWRDMTHFGFKDSWTLRGLKRYFEKHERRPRSLDTEPLKTLELSFMWNHPKMRRRSFYTAPAMLCMAIFFHPALEGYSVLSHEALVDAVWDPLIKQLLLRAYPDASEADVVKAHTYAYGGSVIQDMGYYPFGNRYFSDLAHYVRSGDFIKSLFDEAQDIDEYAFALGTLAHYAADNYGHPLAVNLSVPEMYPELRKKYGKSVTFAQDPKAHVMVEFSFDVAQVAGGGYLPGTYHNFIGFEVAQKSLERALRKRMVWSSRIFS
ncbi:MAG: hypothetical protein DMG57_22090 [Acidobacteria bacterium]|nr:MAG: hypothetical protein DMG57_22090 [Acidobacteriota bacterium]